MKTLNSIKPTFVVLNNKKIKATTKNIAEALFSAKLSTAADVAKLIDLKPVVVDALVLSGWNNLVQLTKSTLPELYEQLAA